MEGVLLMVNSTIGNNCGQNITGSYREAILWCGAIVQFDHQAGDDMLISWLYGFRTFS